MQSIPGDGFPIQGRGGPPQAGAPQALAPTPSGVLGGKSLEALHDELEAVTVDEWGDEGLQALLEDLDTTLDATGVNAEDPARQASKPAVLNAGEHVAGDDPLNAEIDARMADLFGDADVARVAADGAVNAAPIADEDVDAELEELLAGLLDDDTAGAVAGEEEQDAHALLDELLARGLEEEAAGAGDQEVAEAAGQAAAPVANPNQERIDSLQETKAELQAGKEQFLKRSAKAQKLLVALLIFGALAVVALMMINPIAAALLLIGLVMSVLLVQTVADPKIEGVLQGYQESMGKVQQNIAQLQQQAPAAAPPPAANPVGAAAVQAQPAVDPADDLKSRLRARQVPDGEDKVVRDAYRKEAVVNHIIAAAQTSFNSKMKERPLTQDDQEDAFKEMVAELSQKEHTIPPETSGFEAELPVLPENEEDWEIVLDGLKEILFQDLSAAISFSHFQEHFPKSERPEGELQTIYDNAMNLLPSDAALSKGEIATHVASVMDRLGDLGPELNKEEATFVRAILSDEVSLRRARSESQGDGLYI